MGGGMDGWMDGWMLKTWLPFGNIYIGNKGSWEMEIERKGRPVVYMAGVADLVLTSQVPLTDPSLLLSEFLGCVWF